MTKILIVDDNEQNLYMLSVLLQGSGYQVETAANGQEALDKARVTPPDIIITDILMPVIDGFTLCREWKKDGALKTIPFVFYTATYTDPSDEEFALSLGAERFIRKPVEPEVFIGILREVIEQYKAGQLVVKREAVAEEAVYFKLYNETLIRKLEGKVEQLEEANKALKEEITKRKQVEEALKKGEDRFRTSVETLLEGFAILSAVRDSHSQLIDFKYDYINEAGCKMNQKPHEEHMSKTLLELLPTHKEIGLFDEYVRVVETGQPLTKEFLIYEAIYGGGKQLKQAFDVRITRLGDGLVTTWQDLTDKKKREELLRQSEERLRLLIQNSKDIVIMADLEGNIMYYNGPTEYGITAEEVLGKNPFSIFEPVIAARVMNQLKLVIKDGEALTFENAIPLKGESYWFLNQLYPIWNEKGRMIAVGLIARNITEHKRAEDREQLAHEALNLLNRWETTTNTIREILLLFKKKMGFEAVGIRLREGDDFPYFETNGFSEDFVQAERHLCAYDKEGKIVRDGKGNPVLECMCGNILCGRTDAALPFFTAGGSFWTNSTTDLLASTTEEDRQARTRNRCNGEGYESVALIPLRSGDEIIGLLQLNDRRRNQFTLEIIHFFEGVGASVGIALSRKQAEEALKHAASQWQTTFNAIGDSICLIDKEGKILQHNVAMEYLLGKLSPEIVGRHCWEVVHNGSEPIEGCPIARMRESLIRETLVIQQGDRWFNVTTDPLLDEGGNLMGGVHIIVDITEQRRAEEALRENEARLTDLAEQQKMILDALPQLISFTNADLIYRFVNRSYEKFFECKLEEIVGRSLPEVIGPAVWELAERHVRRALAGEVVEYDEVFEYPGKEPRHMMGHLLPHRSATGSVDGYFGVLNDITEHKRAEEKLKNSEERYRRLFENAIDGIVLADVETGIIIDCNKAIEGLVGREKTELIGQSQKILHPPEDSTGKVSRTFAQHRFDKEGQLLETQLITKTDERKQVEIKANILELKGRKILQGIFRDITYRKQAEEERERLLEQLHTSREQLRSLSRRLVEVQEANRRNLSRELHDRVGQNITALNLNLNIIRSQLTPESAIKVGSRLEDSQKLLEETVERIRDVMAELRPPVLDDYGLMATLRWYGDRFSKQTNMVLDIQGEELTPRLPVPVELVLFRIAQEALTNVVKHSQARQVTLTLESLDGGARLTIADNGVGFDLKVPYQPGERPKWGLLTMRERAEAIGGQLHIETAPEKGTKVIVEIPRNK